MAVLAVAASGCAGRSVDSARTAGPALVRFGVIATGGGAELPTILISHGIAQRHGLTVEIVPYGTPGQQFVLVRSGAADVVPGSVLDVVRQRHAGLDIAAFAGFQRFSSPIVVRADSPLTRYDQLRRTRFGEFGPTLLDWLVLRAASRRAYGWDPQGAQLTRASPALLTQLLARGSIDAALQFANLTVGPVARGEERVLTTVPDVMVAANLDRDSLDVTWNVSGDWAKTDPTRLTRLRAAMDEAYRLLADDDAAWQPLVKLVGIDDPTSATATQYIALERRIAYPPFRSSLLRPTQRMLDLVVAELGAHDVGLTTLDPAAFLFPE